jgi:outer membrane biosynthesis protein TonB
MHALGHFEEVFSRRLRRELDELDVRTPLRPRATGPRWLKTFWVARPLAVAAIATIALAGLATAVTASPDPAQWVQPGAWQRALGVAPASPSPTPKTEPSESPEPSGTAEPSESPEPRATEIPTNPKAEPSESPEAPESSQSPEPRESEAPGG